MNHAKKILDYLLKTCPGEMLEAIGLARSLPLLGNRFICPCCGWSFRKFLPYGTEKRPDVWCPKCFSFKRHRLIWLYLKEKTNLFSDKLKMLHIAPEFSFKKKFIKIPNLEYVAADLKSPLANVKMDITDIPYGDDSFDVIICSHVLEHIPNDQKAMKELFRVLKNGGWAILQSALNPLWKYTVEAEELTPADERTSILGKDHKRKYGLDYKEKLERAGFKVKIENFAEELGQDLIRKYALDAAEKIYLCLK